MAIEVGGTHPTGMHSYTCYWIADVSTNIRCEPTLISTKQTLIFCNNMHVFQVPDFNKMYELYDPCTTMFFYRNKHIMIDLGTGNNNKINWAMEDDQEFIDIVETVFRGARKGRGLVVSPKDYSTKYRYWYRLVLRILYNVTYYLSSFRARLHWASASTLR